MKKRFFILGCQRTGTTLVRLILEAHPEVFCYDELNSYAILQRSINQRSIDEDSSRARLVGFKLIGFKIPRWTEQLMNPVMVDAGLNGECENFYRGEKILFLYRDVRDTIASMLRLKSGESSWCETWARSIIHAKLAKDDNFRARYSEELSVIVSSDSSLVGWAALYWKYKTEAFLAYRREGLPVFLIPYERLVSNPRPVLGSICNHLEIPFQETLLRHSKTMHTELFENGLTLGNTDPKKPIHNHSVGQWRKFLSAEDVMLIQRITGDLPEKMAAMDNLRYPVVRSIRTKPASALGPDHVHQSIAMTADDLGFQPMTYLIGR